MKTCVFIIGGNLAGKSTLVRAIANRYGGLQQDNGTITTCNGNLCLAGPYKVGKIHGGVDRLGGTGKLAVAVDDGLRLKDTILCEGSYMDTFGLNLTNAIFRAERQLVVHLYCNAQELYRRHKTRPKAYGKWESILRKHKCVARSATRWSEICVPVMSFDTGVISTEEIADKVIEFINKQ